MRKAVKSTRAGMRVECDDPGTIVDQRVPLRVTKHSMFQLSHCLVYFFCVIRVDRLLSMLTDCCLGDNRPFHWLLLALVACWCPGLLFVCGVFETGLFNLSPGFQ